MTKRPFISETSQEVRVSPQSKPLCATPLARTPNANRTTTTISMSGFLFMNYPAFQSIEIVI